MSDSQSIWLISDLCGYCGSQLATSNQRAWCSQRCTETVPLTPCPHTRTKTYSGTHYKPHEVRCCDCGEALKGKR